MADLPGATLGRTAVPGDDPVPVTWPNPPRQLAGAVLRGLRRPVIDFTQIATLPVLVPELELFHYDFWRFPSPDVHVLWGQRPIRAAAEGLWIKGGKPVVILEDGFVRSLGLGRAGDPPFSVIVDRSGSIFYDTRRASDLETILNGGDFDAATLAESDRVIEAMRRTRVTKYNHLPRREGPPVDALVIDQAYHDRSALYGGASDRTFRAMVEAAVAENGRVAVRTHPDTVAGFRRSYYGRWVQALGARLEPANENLPDRLATVGKVYCATSQAGFEALIHGVPVVTFGRPFYAGWGLTDDRAPIPRRQRKLTLRELVAGAMVRYPRYIDPDTWEPLTPAAYVDRMAAFRDRHAAP